MTSDPGTDVVARDIELTICTGTWMFSGRMLRVFGVDAAACRV